MTQYCYSQCPLLSGAKMTRVLSLLPAKDQSAPIQCQLQAYSLSDEHHSHIYEALSYVWGGESTPKSIFIEENTLPVTENLYLALLHLRNTQLTRVLWVDAICINQGDNQEKADQIPLMAAIYGQAMQVVVWLGEAQEDTALAFQYIQASAKGKSSPLSRRLQERAACVNVLQRPWFRRIWVLQEVAAARSILVMCGTNQMSGYAFCSGLRHVDSLLGTSGRFNLVRAVTYLMRSAALRPKYTGNTPAKSECSIGELIDIYQGHEATKKQDKVYALLGMRSHGSRSPALMPNYEIPWDTVFQRLIKYLIPEAISISTWAEQELAIIGCRGFILGQINAVEIDLLSEKQYAEIKFHHTPKSRQVRRKYGTRWGLPISARPVEKYDLVFLLEGLSRPSIIRLNRGYFELIMITAISRAEVIQPKFPTELSSPWSIEDDEDLYQACESSYLREIMLIWNWGRSSICPDDNHPTALLPASITDHAPEYSETDSEKERRLSNMSAALEDIARIAIAMRHLTTSSAENCVEFVQHVLDQIRHIMPTTKMIVNTFQMLNPVGYMMLPSLISKSNGFIMSEDVLVTAMQNNIGPETVRVLLNTINESSFITLEVFKFAVQNEGSHGYDVLETLLLRRPDLLVSKEVVIKAAENKTHGVEMILLLLDKEGCRLPVSEKMITAVLQNVWVSPSDYESELEEAANESFVKIDRIAQASVRNKKKLQIIQILEHASYFPISENVLVAAAGNTDNENAPEIMKILLNNRGSDFISESVLKAAAGNRGPGAKNTMKNLLDQLEQKESDINQITEDVLAEAAKNDAHGPEIIDLLLKHRAWEGLFSDELLTIAAGNAGQKILESYFHSDINEHLVTQEMIKAALQNNTSFASEIVKCLVEASGEDLRRTEDMLELVAQKGNAELIYLFFGHGTQRYPVTEAVLEAAMQTHYSDPGVIGYLVTNKANDVPILEDMLQTAAEYASPEVMRILIETEPQNLHITNTLLRSAAKNLGQVGQAVEMIQLLLSTEPGARLGASGFLKAVAETSWDLPLIKELLDQGAKVNSADILEAAAGNYSSDGYEIFKLLYTHQEGWIPISEKAVQTAAGNTGWGYEIMKMILQKDIPTISEAVVIAAAGNEGDIYFQADDIYHSQGPEILELLLERNPESVPISEAVLQAAAGNTYKYNYSGLEILQLLFEYKREEFMVSDNVIAAARENSEEYGPWILEYLLTHRKGSMEQE